MTASELRFTPPSSEWTSADWDDSTREPTSLAPSVRSARIALLTRRYPPEPAGGVGTSVFNLARVLSDHGHTVHVFTTCDSGAEFREDSVTRIRAWRDRAGICSKLLALRLRRGGPGMKYQYQEELTAAWLSLRIGRLVRGFRPDFVIAPDRGITPHFLGLPGRSKLVLVTHHNYLRMAHDPLGFDSSLLDGQIAHTLQQRSMRHVDAVVAPSRYMASVFDRTFEWTGPRYIIPNVLDERILQSAALDCDSWPFSNNEHTVFIPSGLCRIKGQDYVFEIVRRLAKEIDGIAFYISGERSRKPLDQISLVGLASKVHAPGHLPYKAHLGLVSHCSVCLSPTIAESFGMAILEAQALGVPAIAFDVGAVSECILTDLTGQCVPFLDVDSLISATARILHDDLVRADLSATAKEHALSSTSRERVRLAYDRLLATFAP